MANIETQPSGIRGRASPAPQWSVAVGPGRCAEKLL